MVIPAKQISYYHYGVFVFFVIHINSHFKRNVFMWYRQFNNYVALESFGLCSYLLARYTRRDIRSNEAAMKYLLMGEVCVSIRVHSLSWLYGSTGKRSNLKV